MARIWEKRTGLEQILLLVSAFLLVSIVVLLVMLGRDSAPMATEWGPVASWASVVVTFLGFVGAIAALRIQKTSAGIASEQHNKTKSEEAEANRIKAEAAEAEALAAKEQYVRAVQIDVSAERPKAPHGSTFFSRPPFVAKCLLVLPANIAFTIVDFKRPEVLTEFKIKVNTAATADLGTVKNGARFHWHVEIMEWPYGVEESAKDWVADRTSATFTDPAGIRWRIDGHKNFTEIPS